MRAISSISQRRRHAVGAKAAAMAAILKRLYAAYVAWRLERSVIAALSGLSDRELSDIGLARPDIAKAARTGMPHDPAPSGNADRPPRGS